MARARPEREQTSVSPDAKVAVGCQLRPEYASHAAAHSPDTIEASWQQRPTVTSRSLHSRAAEKQLRRPTQDRTCILLPAFSLEKLRAQALLFFPKSIGGVVDLLVAKTELSRFCFLPGMMRNTQIPHVRARTHTHTQTHTRYAHNEHTHPPALTHTRISQSQAFR